ncbi:MAG TPA: outer membrane protein assembly factor BamD [Candidatus Acidoferrum sp.]|nr:outer membrane protein assembly factor BamD [Candidatus Acidoferrum sp.]
MALLPRGSKATYQRLASGLLAVLLLGATACDAQWIFHKKKRLNKSTSADNNAQPDKILYDRAIDDIKHGRQEVGRLNMQTLINTYPDSEYLAKAKLAIADSYYKEGGTANLALAVSGYKDFEVFFPFLPEATYAQMQVGLAHYRQMEKPDRDRTQALDAEEEFQVFLQKYPNDSLAPRAQQYLREVQEVLAEGDYRIGYFYYVKGDRRAAATRLLSVATRYPLYSKSDRVLWMMGDIFEKSERKEIASLYYGRIVKDYPLSSLVPQAKDKLKASGVPIPQPDPTALAWMTAEQNTPRRRPSLIKKPLGMLKSGPGTELIVAAKNGAPNLQPESDSLTGGELLTPGGKPSLATPGAAVVATVVPGSTGATAETTTGSENAAGTSDGNAAAGSDGSKDPVPTAATATAPANSAAASSDAPKTDAAAAGADPKADARAAGAGGAPGDDSAKSADATKTADSKGDSKDKKESSSKKKKGLRKIVPW